MSAPASRARLPGAAGWLVGVALGAAGCGDAEPPIAEPRALFAELAARAEAAERGVLAGEDGWLLLGAELRHLSLGPFWGERAPAVSRASRPDWADPLPAILDFAAQLERAGIELLFVPVPAKAVVHPEAVPGLAQLTTEARERLDESDRAFLALLREGGIDVLDLAPAFRAARDTEARPLYCRQDSHWSGAACELTARLIAERVRERPWFAEVATRALASEAREVRIRGDLWQMLGDDALPRESLTLRFVGERGEMGLVPVPPWRESPVLLLGDSHALVFHGGGDMHARGAGLADQLALELGFPVDVLAVRGSGATPSRISLLRRRDGLRGKKLVVWCLSVREFTESAQGWRVLPIRAPGG